MHLMLPFLPSARSPDREDVTLSPVTLGPLLRVGIYANYHRIAGQPNRTGKVAPAVRVKHYPLGLTVRYPMKLYTTCKFWISDIIRHECIVRNQLPPGLAPYLLSNVSLARTAEGQQVLCFDRVADFDGCPSRPLAALGPVANRPFWDSVSQIVRVLRDHDSCLLGVFNSSGYSLLVQKLTPDRWQPVIAELPKLGKRMYYYQLPVLFRGSPWPKFERGLRRFIARFRA